jgi:hypothetical protein
MNKRVLWPAALCLAVFLAVAPRAARAGEFCPARIAQVTSVDGVPATYAVTLAAFSARSLTGAFLLETDAGWYRAPFAPLQTQKTSRGFETPPIYVHLPKITLLRNVWLAQAASDDPLWAPRGVVGCAPDPQPHPANGTTPPGERDSKTFSALQISPPFSYSCKTPFARATVQPNTIDADDLAPGEYAAAQIDLDANGNVVDVAGIDASGGDFTLKKTLEKRVRHMRFSPAVAYCRPVPSINLLTELAPQ